MYTAIWRGSLAVLIALFLGIMLLTTSSRSGRKTGSDRVHLVLIGASIGQAWRLAEWPNRVRASEFTAESIPAWQFDKTLPIEDVLIRPARRFQFTLSYLKSMVRAPPKKADVVILKECSSYFPGDLRVYQEYIRKWCRRLKAHHIKVILATVVPVTEVRAVRDAGKQQGLIDFNRWLREYAQGQNIDLLDLETALRVDATRCYLRDEFDSGDGSHLNTRAYAVLDQALEAVIRKRPLDRITDADRPDPR